jgi:hypothetical protein
MHGSTGGGWHGATYATGQSSTLQNSQVGDLALRQSFRC